MHSIYYLNKISSKGKSLFSEQYQQVAEPGEAEAILVRSASMHDMEFIPALSVISRSGAGVNNIPVDRCTQEGVVVFNTPGANANGVKEMAICGMLLGSRDVIDGVQWVRSIKDEVGVAKKVEKGKSRFAGTELTGKNLGIVGLGAIGGRLAAAAIALGMTVYGYDPYISDAAARGLDSKMFLVNSLEDIYQNSDIITLHVPLLDSTKKMINGQAIGKMKDGVILLNFARDALVDEDALEQALKTGKVKRYVTDFPNDKTAGMEGVIPIPHLGASTQESEDNCAVMAVVQVMDYLENGNITNSVNFPACSMGVCSKPGRIAILHRNIPNSIGGFTAKLAQYHINISNMLNRSKGEYAYTMLDLDEPIPAGVAEEMSKLPGVFRVRVIC